MNYLDIILAVPLAWAIYKGFSKGFIIEIASLVAIILGVYGAIHFSYYISGLLKLSSPYSPLIAFAITFVIIAVVVFTLAKLLEKSANLLALGLINKLAGVFFSLLKMAFILSIVLMFVNKINDKVSFIPQQTRDHSLLYPLVSAIAPLIIPKLNFEELKKKTDVVK